MFRANFSSSIQPSSSEPLKKKILKCCFREKILKVIWLIVATHCFCLIFLFIGWLCYHSVNTEDHKKYVNKTDITTDIKIKIKQWLITVTFKQYACSYHRLFKIKVTSSSLFILYIMTFLPIRTMMPALPIE